MELQQLLQICSNIEILMWLVVMLNVKFSENCNLFLCLSLLLQIKSFI